LCEKQINKFQKTKKIIIQNDKESININFHNKDENLYIKKYWFKWSSGSCRNDVISLLYAYIIKPRIDNLKLTPMGDTIDYFNILSVKSLNLNKEDFSKGI
jgi:hypothetical protein